MNKLFWSGLVFLLLVGSSFAQGTPEIVLFESSVMTVTPDEAESGAYETVLSWQVTNLDESHSLVLQALVLGDWVDMLPDADLQATEQRTHIVPHTLTLESPTIRLIVLADIEIMAVQELIITYSEDDDSAQIDSFTSSVAMVQASDLRATAVLLPISWVSAHRPPNANLVFEQVKADGTLQNIELPRDFLWIRSLGDGLVRPVYEAGRDSLQLRMSIKDTSTGTVYVIQEITIRVIDDLQPVVDTPQDPTIVFFSANVTTASRGETITLSWETRNTTRVWIEYWALGSSPIQSGGCFVVDATYSDLPIRGSLAVMMPAQYAGEGIRFNLVVDEYGCQSRGLSQAFDVELLDDTVTTDPEIIYFTVDRDTVRRGETVTLSWETRNADTVWIEYWATGTSPIVAGGCMVVDATLSELPTTGSIEVPIPTQYVDSGQGVRFNLVVDEYGCQLRGVAQALDVAIID